MDLRGASRSTARTMTATNRRPLPRLAGRRSSASSGRLRLVHQSRGLSRERRAVLLAEVHPSAIGDTIKAKSKEVSPAFDELSIFLQLIKERKHPLDLIRELLSNSGLQSGDSVAESGALTNTCV